MAQQTVRVSLPGSNALTETNKNNYALFADTDNVLLKEAARGNLASGGSYPHGLNYYPFYLTYGDLGAGVYQLATGYDAISGVPRARTTPTTLKTAGNAMKYYVFYDNMN